MKRAFFMARNYIFVLMKDLVLPLSAATKGKVNFLRAALNRVESIAVNKFSLEMRKYREFPKNILNK